MSDPEQIVRHFFRNWQQTATTRGDDAGFYEVLSEIDAAKFVPGADALIGITGDSDLESHLIKLWDGWEVFFKGQEERGIKILQAVADKFPDRPEPWILIACTSFLQKDRKSTYDALQKAKENGPDIEALQDLLKHFGDRQKPAVPFLDRSNPINVSLGKARSNKTNF